MVEKAVKHKIFGLEDGPSGSRRKKTRKKMVSIEDAGGQSSEDIVKEFLKLTAVKQTRLKGFKQFLTIIQNAEEKYAIILKYVQSNPDCSELFEVLNQSPEQRSLFEVELVLEILEAIVLQLAEDDTRTTSQAAVIASRLLTNHRKLVYHCLSSASSARLTIAVLKLLTAIVMHGPVLAREMLTAFDFSHKMFSALGNRRDTKEIVDVRTCFIKFVLSFFVTGDPPLVQQVLQIKGFATSILKNIHKDSAEVIHLILSTLLTKIVQNRSILRKTKILLFTSYSLTQLAKLYTYEDDSSIRKRIHAFLLELCSSQHGIAFENKLGIFSVRSNNPVLLRFLQSLPKTLDDDLLIELIIRILQNSQDLISPFLSGYQMALDPRNSQQWLNNFIFVIKTYFHLPMPRSIFKNPAITSSLISSSRLLTVVCPENVKRNIVTRGLQHPDAVVQGTTLSMILVILSRSCNMIQSSNVDDTILTSFRENILKLLPSFQILVSIRENLSSRTIEARDCSSENIKDLPPQLSIKDATILLSRTLACMSLFQILSPNCFIQSSYDPWKLLPQTSEEEPLYKLSSKYSMLRIFLSCPSRHFKWHTQGKAGTSVYFKQILQLYCHERDCGITDMARELLDRFLVETGVCKSNNAEVSIWLHNILDDCIDDREVVINFFEKVYCRLASDPFDLVDDVIESVHAATVTQSHITKDPVMRSMPFTPIVPCALKLFACFLKDIEKQSSNAENLDILARYLNLVLLDILEVQNDPRPLCNIIIKIFAQDNMMSYPLHTGLLLDYVTHWSTEINSDDKRKFSKNITHSQKTDVENSEKLANILGGLPCSLIVRQLLMFVMKYWKSGTAILDNTSFKTLVEATKVAAKQGNSESWDRTVSATLYFANNVVGLYLENSGNQPLFLEIARTVTEILRITFEKAREVSTSCNEMDIDDDLGDNFDNDVTGGDVSKTRVADDDVTNKDITSDDVVDDVMNNDIIHEDVLSVLDKTCEVKSSSKTIKNDRNMVARLIKMVFECDFIRSLFYCQTENDSLDLRYVSRIMSDCTAELMRDFREEVLQEKNCEYLESYICRISKAVKQDAYGGKIDDVELPYNISSTCLFKIFHQFSSSRVLNEILQTYLTIPKEQFTEIRGCSGEEESVLNGKGETLIQIMECFADREESHLDDLSSEVADSILDLLMSINFQKCDELIAKFVTNYSELSETILSAVLNHSLKQVTSVRIQTAVLVICQKAELLTQVEDWLLNNVDGKLRRKGTGRKELKFLESESEWETLLPLLLFYVSTAVEKEENASYSEQSEKCLRYIRSLSWPKLKEWLLEERTVAESNDCLKMMCLLLDGDDIDHDLMRNLFAETVVREVFFKLNICQLEAVDCILQHILRHSSNEKDQKVCRTTFVYVCMQRLIELMKNKKGEDSLRLKILHYLDTYGKESLRFKKTETFSVEDFVNVTNTFVKSALRFCFTCSETLRVLGVLIKAIYESCSSELLLLPSQLYQFILNHSKFLEIFLGNTDACGEDNAKEALVDLLQTVVDLDAKCCESFHWFLILGAYSAKLSLTDQKLLRLLFTYEANLGDVALGSSVLWGEAAIKAYQAGKDGHTTLWHEHNITQVLDLLDSKLLMQSAKHFPQHKPLQPNQCEDLGSDSQFYDPSFLLPIFSFFLAPGYEVNCRRFVESSALAYTISALTCHEREIRQIAYQILSRFQQHLSSAKFREKQQVAHLLHFFQNGITEADCRISSLMTSFMTRALHIFFYPEDPLYPSVNSYMLQKAFMDLRDVPLFLSHLNNSDTAYRTERIWLLHLILDGLRDPMDYYICKKFHVFQQLFTLYNSAVADKAIQKLTLQIVHAVCLHHAAVYDLCQNYGLVPWLHLLINKNSLTSNNSDNVCQIVDILTTLWFTLTGQTKSCNKNNNDVATHRSSIPWNVCSELLLVLLSVLHSTISLQMWNADTFSSFTSLLASLLEHQDRWTIAAEVILTQQHCVKICEIWRHLFGNIDIYSKLLVLMKTDSCSSQSKLSSEKWFDSMNNILQIFDYSGTIQCTEETQSSLRLENKYLQRFLQRKLRDALQAFLTISDTRIPTKDRLKLLFLSKVVLKLSSNCSD